MCHATTWQGSQFTLSRLAADLCLVPHSYSADRGGGAAGSVITKNCCVGRNRHVNSALTEEKELCVHFIFVHQVCPEIQNQRVFMLFWIRSVLGSFRNAPHIPADKCVSLVLARGELSFTFEHHSMPYAKCLSSECPEIGTLLKHKSPERQRLTFFFFSYNHSLLRRANENVRVSTHTHTHTYRNDFRGHYVDLHPFPGGLLQL